MLFSKVRLFKRFISLYSGCNFKFSPPKKCNILIFDGANRFILDELFSKHNLDVLFLRGEVLNLFVLVISIFRKGSLYNNYIDVYLNFVNPTVLISMIDNLSDFYLIKKRNPGIKIISIQNGIRDSVFFESLNSKLNYESDRLFIFGSGIAKCYDERIHGKKVEIGSVKNNHVPNEKKYEKNTLLYISQFRETEKVTIKEKEFSFLQFFKTSDEIIIKFLESYANNTGRKYRIVLASNSPKEKFYFEEMTNSSFDGFIEKNGEFSAYKALDGHEVIVSNDSTLGYEAAARGCKVAFFPIRSELLNLPDRKFGWPMNFQDSGKFWTNIPNNEQFENILSLLFSIDSETWNTLLKEIDFKKNIMNYDPRNAMFLSEVESMLIRKK